MNDSRKKCRGCLFADDKKTLKNVLVDLNDLDR